MANKEKKHAKNIDGNWFCTDPDDTSGQGCIACSVCYMGAPDFFAEDEEGNAYVCKQPESAADIELCEEQMDMCPVESIGRDG